MHGKLVEDAAPTSKMCRDSTDCRELDLEAGGRPV